MDLNPELKLASQCRIDFVLNCSFYVKTPKGETSGGESPWNRYKVSGIPTLRSSIRLHLLSDKISGSTSIQYPFNRVDECI